jgi:hypothetical protein
MRRRRALLGQRRWQRRLEWHGDYRWRRRRAGERWPARHEDAAAQQLTWVVARRRQCPDRGGERQLRTSRSEWRWGGRGSDQGWRARRGERRHLTGRRRSFGPARPDRNTALMVRVHVWRALPRPAERGTMRGTRWSGGSDRWASARESAADRWVTHSAIFQFQKTSKINFPHKKNRYKVRKNLGKNHGCRRWDLEHFSELTLLPNIHGFWINQ